MRSLKKNTINIDGYVYKYKRQEEEIHEKAIINEKMYDTEKGQFICLYNENRILLKTKKGNYFSCTRETVSRRRIDGEEVIDIYKTYYKDIREETEESVKDYIGRNEMDLYIKLFGEVEEA